MSGYTSRWTPEQLQLIWRRKVPPEATLEDFQMFLYVTESRDMDPLLGEVYCRKQWDRESQEHRLIILDGVHGLLKSADKTGELNGIKTTFQEIDTETGKKLLSATTCVWRKGCDQPFEFTAYWDEFVGLHNGSPNYFWANKGHVMLGKCSTAGSLRLAFAAALAGVYIPEEFDHTETPEPDSEFVVGRLTPDVASEVKTELSDPGFGTHIKEAIAIVKDIIAHPKEEPPPDAMPLSLTETKAKNTALVQRFMLDLEVEKSIRVTVLKDFYQGYLGVELLPNDPALFTPALEALDVFATNNRDAHDQFIRGPLALGKRLREESEKHAEAKA